MPFRRLDKDSARLTLVDPRRFCAMQVDLHRRRPVSSLQTSRSRTPVNNRRRRIAGLLRPAKALRLLRIRASLGLHRQRVLPRLPRLLQPTVPRELVLSLRQVGHPRTALRPATSLHRLREARLARADLLLLLQVDQLGHPRLVHPLPRRLLLVRNIVSTLEFPWCCFTEGARSAAPGERTHIPDSSQAIYHILSEELNRFKATTPVRVPCCECTSA